MSASSDPELLRRFLEFERKLKRESSEIVERHDWGRLIVNPPTRALWTDSFLEVEAADLGAAELAALADESLGAHGIEHRLIVSVNPSHGKRLTPAFRELGWEVWRSLYMALKGSSEREAPAAVEVSRAEADPVRRAVAEADPDFTPEAIDQSAIRDARLDRAGNGRWFAAPAEGPRGAACVLYEQESIGQVEFVGTRPELRGRGLASAVVLAAAETSRQAGHELTFIVADADDWPWKLYERLGFDPVGESCAFLRKPDQPGLARRRRPRS